MGTGAALLSTLVWELYGGDGVVSTGTGLLSVGAGLDWVKMVLCPSQ